MSQQDSTRSSAPASSTGLTFGTPAARERSWLPVVLAVVVVAVVTGILVLMLHTQGEGSRDAQAYAASMAVSGVEMSDSGNLGGGHETYLDGTVTNHGGRTVKGVTVQVTFKDFSGGVAAVDTLPITLIRFRQPYVDVEPVSQAPIAPGESRPFRVAFDAVPDSWDQSYPQVKVTGVVLR